MGVQASFKKKTAPQLLQLLSAWGVPEGRFPQEVAGEALAHTLLLLAGHLLAGLRQFGQLRRLQALGDRNDGGGSTREVKVVQGSV